MFLNCHSWFSLRYGLMPPEELVREAAARGVTTLALTDVNNTSGVWDFVRHAKANGIRPVVGIDFRTGATCHRIGLARNAAGFAALCHHLSTGEPCDAEHVEFVYPWSVWKARKEHTPLRKNEWVGVRAEEVAEFRLLEHSDVPWDRLVALHTVTFRHQRDWNCHRLLRAMAGNTLLSKLGPDATGSPRDRWEDDAAIRARFDERPEWVERSDALLDRCGIEWPEPPPGRLHNNQHTYTGSEAEDERLIRTLCAEGLAYRYPDHEEAVLERMERELEVIARQGYLAYFLINWDITSYARSRGYFYVGRGSGANSLVAYLLRITDVDPIELDLYFERFINLYRKNPPDFDIDFSWTDRDDVTRYIFERFEHVALVGAYSTFQYRAVVRELGKVFGLPKADIDVLAEGRFDPNQLDEMEQLVVRYAGHLKDQPSALTIHACGILIADRPIHHYCATFLPPKGFPTTQFDMLVAEDVGLYKFDILSQRGLGKIRDAMDFIARNHPDEAAGIDIHDMKRFKADPAIQTMLRNAEAIGCFYVESPAMRMLLRKLNVDHYLGLVAASSVIRPGVAKSGMMKAYIERHRHPEKRQEAHPVLLKLMPETYGVMVYQEDVIKVAHHFAGLDLSEADVLRRGMSGKFRSQEEFAKAAFTFQQKALDAGRTPEEAREVWRQVESFAGYAFAKGHSASYAVESYQSLFLKAHWPLEYMAACINNFGGFYRTEFYVHEARMLEAEVEEPCVNEGGWEADVIGKRLILGFNLIKGVEAASVGHWLDERQTRGAFRTLSDFVERTGIGLEQLVLLIRAGGFRFTGNTPQALLWEAHFLLGHGKPQQPSLFAGEKREEFALPPLEHGRLERTFDQIELLGFPLNSPFELLTTEAQQQLHAATPARSLQQHIGRFASSVGYLVTVKETRTGKGERMCFGCFIDSEGHWLDSVHFPPALKRQNFRGRGIYRIAGPVREEYGCVHIEAHQLEKLSYIADPRYAEGEAAPKSSRRMAPSARSAGTQLKRSLRPT